MELFILFSLLISLAATFSYINVRYIKLPSGISLMLMSTVAALGVILVGHFSTGFGDMVRQKLALIDFSEFLLGILLSFLLFAGSLHVQLPDLRKEAKSITVFAVFGTLISTFLVGFLVFLLLRISQQEIPLIYCLLFGALISPTDPIAVMGILKKANLSKSVETNIVGESLFNDGIGVVVFATLLQIATVGIEHFGAADIALLFVEEAIGGLLVGLIIGFLGYRFMKSIDHFQTEILISLAMVMGGYSLCHFIHVSGPLAMVVAGIMTGNRGKALAMSDVTRDYLGKFWEVTDEVLNAILFLLIGLEIIVVKFEVNFLFVGFATAMLLVVARFISLFLPAFSFGFKKELSTKTLTIMTWGGLRGGISIALALSLPPSPFKDVIVSITFIVVLFSILVQGLTIDKLIKRILPGPIRA
ncbi:sodium/proton antiporter, CPA1 family [Chitinophaga eiseniae]|uniref:Sodium/proton antiporter, CPA1 family n=1 Tax=Chitinophaga eiseniae TaxID=634771 RepID=A0A1T4SWT3_9BACT|nr:sodium:proton antiporter [Chitinophaga eiseniae]SKA32627.1 sodium/proton antiporter, CPA1 family [Chitinophaga eiseniae]